MKTHVLFVLISLLNCHINAWGQDYFTNGNATRLPNSDCYRLTANANFQNGSVWYSDKLNLAKDFRLEFNMNLGNQDANGADGIVFVIQTVGTKALGASGGGIGFTGFSPAFGIEFDTYQNGSEGDPSYDHLAFLKNGVNNHNSANNLAGPVQIAKNNANVEDGKDHLVVVQWIEASKTLQLYFDCDLRLSANIDLAKSIFNNQTEVFWGFTAATGGASNNQTVCLRKDILIQDSFSICNGEFIAISSGVAFDNKYSWLPNEFINNANVQKPIINPNKSGYYIASYKDFCNNTIQDSIWITVRPGPVFNLGKDTVLCENTTISLNAFSPDASNYIWDNNSTSPQRVVTKAGIYWARASLDKCFFIDSITITGINQPKIALGADTILCIGEELVLTVDPSLNHNWEDNSTVNNRTITTSGLYWVNSTNFCGVAVDSIAVSFIPSPTINLGMDTSLCLSEKLQLEVKDTSIAVFLWQDGSAQSSYIVAVEGKYFVEVTSKNGCKGSDTIDVVYINPPTVFWPSDTTVCRNEILQLQVIGKELNVFWNGILGSEVFEVVNYSGTIEMQASNNCGIISNQINVAVKNCVCNVYFPNAITANEDYLNETFHPVYDCIWQDYHLQVFNRWGEKVFETFNPKEAWDAKYKHVNVTNDYYIWIANYTALENTIPTIFTQKGIVYVLR